MEPPGKKNIWNRRKGVIRDDNKDLEKDDLISDEEKTNEMILRVQQRLGISREEAKNIIRNSELS